MKKFLIISCTIVVVLGIGGLWFFNQKIVKPTITNNSYETNIEVEQKMRAMIVNYNQYKSEYDQYKTSCDTKDEALKCQRAMNAKTSANQTVSAYNEYVKQKYKVEGNIPEDLPRKLIEIGGK